MNDEPFDPAFQAELRTIFREEAAERVSALHAHLRTLSDPAGDHRGALEGAKREAHTIKGSAGTVGEQAMRSIALRLEKRLDLLARDGRPPGASDLQPLSELCRQLDEQLRSGT